jgi:hypothetical protein
MEENHDVRRVGEAYSQPVATAKASSDEPGCRQVGGSVETGVR